MNLNITKQDSSTDETHEGIGLYEQNNLHTLSLKGCKLSSKTTSSLIHSLQSPHCKLHRFSLNDCVIFTTDHTYQFSTLTLLVNNSKVSLNATGSCCAINHWLSLLSSSSKLLTDMILCITEQDSSTDEILEGIGLYEQNNLHTLSLKGCKLSSKIASSLIHSLQSPHCKLHKISLNDCVIFTTDHTYQFSTLTLLVNNSKVSLNATGSCCAINHWLSLLSSSSKLLTDMNLNITKQDSSTDETHEGIGLYEQNNLHTLSLKGCKLSSKTTSSLIHSLQSPHCKLHIFSLNDCVIFTTDHTYQFCTLTLQVNNSKVSLNATGSCCAINHWLSLLSPYSKLLTDMILNITEQDYSTDELLEEIGLYHHEQNSLTLSLTKCKLSNEALISSLLFPHCKLHKLSLHDCTISTTDYSCQFSFFELQQANAKVSLNATGSYCAMNHWLSQSSSYSTLLTDMILCITEQDSSTDETLEGIGLYEQNNLHSLSLKGCKLSSKTTSSLIHSLQSPYCKLHRFSLNDCVIFATDHTYQFSTLTLLVNNSKVTSNATGSCCAINHWLSLLSSSSKLLTYMNLNITKQDSSTDELLEEIGLYHHEQNSLTLSLTKCKLRNETLISSLLFPRCKLHKLSLHDCTISTTDYSCQFSFFELQQANAKVSLNATGSYCAMNHWLSQSSSYSTLLTDMILCITEQDSSTDETLEGIGLYEQNNLHTLSLKGCKLSSKTTSSLIHSLQSPHCKLHKISLNGCVILQVNNGKVSLNATGSCCAINHWLSQLSSYSVTELILSITKQESVRHLWGLVCLVTCWRS